MSENHESCSPEVVKLLADGAYGRAREINSAEGGGSAVEEFSAIFENNDRRVLRGMVQVAVECGDALVSIAEMSRDVHVLTDRSQAIATAAEEMVASVRDITRASQAAAADADTVEASAGEGMRAAERAVETMHNIFRAVEDAVAKVDALAEASIQIGQIVESIEAIAKQTNLLALNATIEAARAGEAGKGFAVVAGEVKNLANQTASATIDIRNRIEHLRVEMAAIAKSMQDGAKAVREGEGVIVSAGDSMRAIGDQVGGVTSKMQEIASILVQQSEASVEIAEGVTTIADLSKHNSSEIDHVVDAMDKANAVVIEHVQSLSERDIANKVVFVAKSDHTTFKKNVVAAVIGRADLRAEALADHRHCRLGKWYYSVTDERIRKSGAFGRLEDPHERVHRHGKESLKALEAGNRDRALASAAEMERASREVLELLDRLAADLEK